MKNNFKNTLYESYTSTHIRTDANVLLNQRESYFNKFIKNYFPIDKKAKILDIGCGYGALIFFLRKHGYVNVEGVDLSPEQVACARELGIHGVKQGDLGDLILSSPEINYDAVVAFDLLEHLERDELIEFFSQVRRVLRPGGSIILHIPNGASPFFGRVRYGDMTHEICFTQHSISQLMSIVGFKDVTCFEESPAVTGFISLSRWCAWKFFRFIMCCMLIAESGERGEIFSQNFVVIAR